MTIANRSYQRATS